MSSGSAEVLPAPAATLLRHIPFLRYFLARGMASFAYQMAAVAVDFVRRNPMILGTISLDLFAVLLGGATALLPIYARDVLQHRPLGAGAAARRVGRGGAADDHLACALSH